MELGDKSLRDHFTRDVANMTDDEIRKVAKQIVLAMRDFHRGLCFIPILFSNCPNPSCNAFGLEARKHDVLP
jgi:hypothetical protein